MTIKEYLETFTRQRTKDDNEFWRVFSEVRKHWINPKQYPFTSLSGIAQIVLMDLEDLKIYKCKG